MFTRLKNGGPTLISVPVTPSVMSGKIVPNRIGPRIEEDFPQNA